MIPMDGTPGPVPVRACWLLVTLARWKEPGLHCLNDSYGWNTGAGTSPGLLLLVTLARWKEPGLHCLNDSYGWNTGAGISPGLLAAGYIGPMEGTWVALPE
jgi:hypothetical protein